MDLAELQKMLQEVQQEKPNSLKLGDRVIVEIIDKLLKKSEISLYFGSTGDEYITPEKLDEEIYETVSSYGRINIAALPDMLRFSTDKIQSRIDNVIRKWPNINKVEDQLLTSENLDEICFQIDLELQEKNVLYIGEISKKFSLPINWFKDAMLSRVGTVIDGTISSGGDKLYTTNYKELTKSKIRGLIRGCMLPVPLSTITTRLGVENDFANTLIESMIKEGQLKGKVSASSYIPENYNKCRDDVIRKFYKQNKYVTYELVSKVGGANPKKFLGKIMGEKELIFLDLAAISKEMIESLKEQIESFLSNEGFCDIKYVMDTEIFTENDFDLLHEKHFEMEDCHFQGEYVFSSKLIQDCQTAFKELIVQKIFANPKVTEELKGKKGKKGKGEDSILSKAEIKTILKDKKLMESDDLDEEELISSLETILIPLIKDLYETTKTELFEGKKSKLTESLLELQRVIEEKMFFLSKCLPSIQRIEESDSKIGTISFVESMLEYSKTLLENILLLCCKKWGIQLPQSYLEEIDHCVKNPIIFNGNRIFKSIEQVNNLIEKINSKPTVKALKDSFAFTDSKNVSELIKYLITNCDSLYFKFSNDKKYEKSAYKSAYQHLKMSAKGLKANSKEVLFHIIQMRLIENEIVIVGGNSSMNKVLFTVWQCFENDENIKDLLTSSFIEEDNEAIMDLFKNLKI